MPSIKIIHFTASNCTDDNLYILLLVLYKNTPILIVLLPMSVVVGPINLTFTLANLLSKLKNKA